jgi:hypothetical protein
MLWRSYGIAFRSYGIAFKEREDLLIPSYIYVFHVDVLTLYAGT